MSPKTDNSILTFPPLLAREEERDLARRAIDGDDAAEKKLIESNLSFVMSVARVYKRSGVPMSDLFQEGILGLIQAVKRFDPEFNTRLSTYAKWWIRASIQDYIVRSWSLVRLSTTSTQKSLFLSLKRRTWELMEGADNFGENIAGHLAERFETTASDVISLARRITHRDISINFSNFEVIESDAKTPEQLVEEQSERLEMVSIMKWGLDKLPAREQFIIKNRYFVEVKRTFASIGQDLGLSKDRVRQLEFRALETLRKLTEASLIRGEIIVK